MGISEYGMGWGQSPIMQDVTKLALGQITNPGPIVDLNKDIAIQRAYEQQEIALQQAQREEAEQRAIKDYFEKNPEVALDPNKADEASRQVSAIRYRYGTPDEISKLLSDTKNEKKDDTKQRHTILGMAAQAMAYSPEIAVQLGQEAGLDIPLPQAQARYQHLNREKSPKADGDVKKVQDKIAETVGIGFVASSKDADPLDSSSSKLTDKFVQNLAELKAKGVPQAQLVKIISDVGMQDNGQVRKFLGYKETEIVEPPKTSLLGGLFSYLANASPQNKTTQTIPQSSISKTIQENTKGRPKTIIKYGSVYEDVGDRYQKVK